MVADGTNGEEIRQAYVVDDDVGFRNSLEALLTADGWAVRGFDSADAFLSAAEDMQPGLLLLDLNLPGLSGLDLLESAPAELERFGVVMITGAGQIQTAVRSIQAGALDFIEKPFAAGQALDKLDQMHCAFRGTMGERTKALDARRRIALLSPRERDVLERLLAGASNKLIARDLDLSPRTVEMHRARMLQKLAVRSTSQALEIGRFARLVAVEPLGGDSRPRAEVA